MTSSHDYGWPWMKDANTSLVESAIEPFSDFDDRPDVHELIQQNREKIDAIQRRIRNIELYQPSKHDDLFILRFLLSQKKVAKAVEAINDTLIYRHKHQLDETDIRFWKVTGPDSDFETVRKTYLPSHRTAVSIPSSERSPISYIYLNDIDHSHMIQCLTEDELAAHYRLAPEYMFQWCDYITRTTGRLTKQLRIGDFRGFNGRKFTRKGMSLGKKYMADLENCYPQVLGAFYWVNVPLLVNTLWGVAKTILPKRTFEKTDILNLSKRRDVEKLLRFTEKEWLPKELGGTADRWPASLKPQ